jgi:hypothetical protein
MRPLKPSNTHGFEAHTWPIIKEGTIILKLEFRQPA